jgi:hypothetical protein
MLSLPDPGKLPFDPRWFSESQYDHLLNVIGAADGMAVIAGYYYTVRARVDACRDSLSTPGETIRTVMAQTRSRYPGIETPDLVPITRGILNAIFAELPE